MDRLPRNDGSRVRTALANRSVPSKPPCLVSCHPTNICSKESARISSSSCSDDAFGASSQIKMVIRNIREYLVPRGVCESGAKCICPYDYVRVSQPNLKMKGCLQRHCEFDSPLTAAGPAMVASQEPKCSDGSINRFASCQCVVPSCDDYMAQCTKYTTPNSTRTW